MKLHRIEVRGWQCFADALTVGPFGPGLNVVHADNGRGKSTLFAALRRAIFDGHRTGGAEINRLRPWGRQLTPFVCVELEREGVSYRIEKRFLDTPSSRLLRNEHGAFTPLAEGDAADEQMRRLLHGTRPGRGAADKAEHWGLAAVLWAPQGSLALAELSGPLSSRIRTSLAAQAGLSVSTVEQTVSGVELEIERRYLAVFTEHGKLRTGQSAAPEVTLQTTLEALEAERNTLAPQVLAFEEASRRVEELRAARDHAGRIEQQAAQQVKRLQADASRFETLSHACELAREREEKIRHERDALDRAVTQLAEARGRLRDANAELARRAAETSELEAAVVAARARADAAAATRAATLAERKEIEAAAIEAEQADAFVRALARVTTLGQQCAKATEADRLIQLTRRQLDDLHAPTPKELAAIRTADAARRDARTALELSLIALRFEPIKDTVVCVRVGEPSGSTDARAGQPLVVRGAPEVVIEIDGVGTLRASGPTGSADTMRASLETAELQFARLTRPFGTGDVTLLQARVDQAAELQADLIRGRAQREAALGERSLELANEDLARAQAEIERLTRARPEWRTTPPDPLALAEQVRERRRVFERGSDQAQRALDTASAERFRAERATIEHAARLESLREQARSLQASLAQLESTLADDATRERRLADLNRGLEEASGQLADATTALSGFDEDPRQALERAIRQLDSLRAAAAAKGEAEKRAEGQLEQLAQAGAYSRLSDVLEQLAATQDALARERSRTVAIKLLRETLQEERRQAVEAVCGPVEQRATEYLHRIGSPRLGRVRMTESFTARGVDPVALNGSPDAVELDRLSGGEQEQVHLAVRLALADVLCQSEGNQLLVLDDVLIATDAGRLGRVRDVLAECAQRLQVIVLSCHPDRYVGIPGATYVDLEALL